MVTGRAVFTLLALVACGENDGAPLADAGGRFLVSVVDDRVTLAGDVAAPTELLGAYGHTIDGDGVGVASEYAPGMYSFASVPYETIVLRVGVEVPFEYFVTPRRELELGRARPGRQAVIGTPGTELELSITGLDPWQTGDDLYLVSGNAHLMMWLPSHLDLAPDATAASGSADFRYEPLVDSDLGDDLLAYQSQRYSGVDGGYSRLTHAGVGEARMSNGMASSAAIALSEVPQKRQAIDFRCYEFESLFDEVSSTGLAWPSGCELHIEVQPGGQTHGPFSRYRDSFNTGEARFRPPPLLTWRSLGDFTGEVSYGNPFPAFWTPYVRVETSSQMYILLQGTEASDIPAGGIRVWRTVADLANGPIVPLISPPLEVKIDGADVGVAMMEIATDPTISWSQPRIGTATSYEVTVMRLAAHGDFTMGEPVARYYTTELSVAVRDVFVPGTSYYVIVTAMYLPGVDRTVHPHRTAFPWGAADAVSGILEP